MRAAALTRFVARLPAHGSFSLWAGSRDGEAWFTSNDQAQHYAASTMKLPLVLAAYREAEAGRLDLDASVVIRNDFCSASGSGRFGVDPVEDEDPEPWHRLGQPVAVRWLCHRALVRSSNLATNLVLDAVGLDAVAEALSVANADGITVKRGIEDAAARDAGLDNVVTAAGLAAVLRSIATGSVASEQTCGEIIAILLAQQFNDAIPAGLPPEIRVAHKSGWVTGTCHDAAMIYPPENDPCIFVMCTTSDLDDHEGAATVAAGASALWSDLTANRR